MDRKTFDGLTKILASSVNRRAALGALLGTGLAGLLTAAEAKKDRKKGRKNSRKGGKAGKGGSAALTAEAADCANPGPSANISGCPYQNGDFSGDDLSGSRMVGTNFRNAEMAGTNLSSSNAKNAIFREADLTCANLHSSTLGGADFRAADLTGATLKSSGGCNTAQFNPATTFCATTMCDGSVRNDDCPGGFDPDAFCCADADCGGGETCIGNQCVAVCPSGFGIDTCRCFAKLVGGATGCVDPGGLCFAQACTSDAGCPAGQPCVTVNCPQTVGRCASPCPLPDPCVCPAVLDPFTPSICGRAR